MKIIETRYGTLARGRHTVTVSATQAQLMRWARRPGEAWPCSQLARLGQGIRAEFTEFGDLTDIEHPGAEDIDVTEFDAWSDTVITEADRVEGPEGGEA